MARRTAPHESPWGHGEVHNDGENTLEDGDSSRFEVDRIEEKDDFSELAKEVASIQKELGQIKKERDDLLRELMVAKAETKRHKAESETLNIKLEEIEKEQLIGKSGLKVEVEEKIKQSDSAINEHFSDLLIEQAHGALHNPSVESFLKINDRATREVILEEWKKVGVLPEALGDDDIRELANMSDGDFSRSLKFLQMGGAVSFESPSPKVEDSFSEETKEEFASPDLINGIPPDGLGDSWEEARSVYVHEVDKQELGGLIQATIGNIDSMFLMSTGPKDREWIRKRIRQELEGIEAYSPEILLPKMGIKRGTLQNLRSGIDSVNLLPVFSNESIMAPIIKDAEKNRDKSLEDPDHVVKVLRGVLSHAKRTKSSL